MLVEILGIAPDVEVQKHLTSVRFEEWLREDVFHFRWWFLLALLIFYAFAWWKLVDKTRLHEITLYMVLTIILTMGIVEHGNELTLWDYPTDILPVFPPLTAIDLASLPILYSLFYQFFKSWKSFIFASLIITGIYSFILQPALSHGGFYQLLKWKYYYGFPIYVSMSIFIRLLVIKIFAITKKWKESN
jgi:hypothetical protein